MEGTQIPTKIASISFPSVKNQKYTEKHTEIPVCVGSHKLDYRPAWQVDKPIKKKNTDHKK